MTTKEKLSLSDNKELLNYIQKYAPFQNELSVKPKMTIKQFCMELAKEMSYHRNLDKQEGIAK
ncbi:MAG: hypothetical protein WC365_09740 [Candidatus Babeliales bacterium]|jgi:hypothetical protein